MLQNWNLSDEVQDYQDMKNTVLRINKDKIIYNEYDTSVDKLKSYINYTYDALFISRKTLKVISSHDPRINRLYDLFITYQNKVYTDHFISLIRDDINMMHTESLL